MDSETNIPDKFKATIEDFMSDINITFPELSNSTQVYMNMSEEKCEELFSYCSTFYPPHFFNILYQNEDLYKEEKLFFIPNIDFHSIFNCKDISENTRNTIWKYLQIILLMVAGNIKDKTMFGETANIFEGIEEGDLEEKLKETMNDIQGFFSNMNLDASNVDMSDISNSDFESMFKNMSDSSNSMPFDMPNIENIHSHLKSLFDGKIGKFAKELAEELSDEFTNISGDGKSTQGILKEMMKNPKKIMDLVKTIGEKIKNKMDSGEISKEELMGEASEILSKMKEMGGTKEFNNMFKKFAGNMGKNSKINMGALQTMAKQESIRERMRNKIKKKQDYTLTEETPNNMVFSINEEEKQERSMIQKKNEDELIAMFENSKNDDVAVKKKKKKKKKN